MIHFSFMTKIIRILRSCSMKIFSKFPTVNISKLHLDFLTHMLWLASAYWFLNVFPRWSKSEVPRSDCKSCERWCVSCAVACLPQSVAASVCASRRCRRSCCCGSSGFWGPRICAAVDRCAASGLRWLRPGLCGGICTPSAGLEVRYISVCFIIEHQ